MSLFSVLLLAALLILPAIALRRFNLEPLWVLGYIAVVNLIAWVLYGHDKRCAVEGTWRVPESTLHLLELAGGWPAAYLAQRWFQHKCSKGSYQFVFWMIVLAYQYAALDSWQSWRFTKALLDTVERVIESSR